MKTHLICAALTCMVFALTNTPAMAGANPIPGVDVIVKKHPIGHSVMEARTDANGNISLKGLPPGDYEADIDGKSLYAATARFQQNTPAQDKSSDSSMTPGAGSKYGRNSSQPDDASRSSSRYSGQREGSDRNALGGGGVQGTPTKNETFIELLVVVVMISTAWDRENPNATNNGSGSTFEAKYARDASMHSLRIPFTIPKDIGVAGARNELGRTLFLGVTVKY